VKMAYLALKDPEALLESLDFLVYLERMESLGLQEKGELQESQGPRDQLVHLALLGLLALLVRLALLGNLEFQDPLGYQEKQGDLGKPERKDPLDHQDLKDDPV